ncbi:DUF1194 domain-containing protein [Pararhizobium sp.]|uniref:DUF1194 domain-containing protein n=1 Tax=Pararhizobium sp. TaxID=1977563 RepID=UPI00271C3DD6|nr:DUF1194 domain-containing protein [Pararhizobium sp.]MDO9414681.1 DUF1194 domain-containing protein [Pararhizobium sp.]
MITTLAVLLSLAGAAPGQMATAVAGSSEVDVELVLAVDMSGSMDIGEAEVQRSGYIEAIRHPDFIKAVRSGLTGRIAISYFEWAGSVNDSSVLQWQIIETPDDALTFASRLEAQPVTTWRGTSISKAVTYGASLIEGNAFQGLRRVIDVSGDGPNNAGPPVGPARDTVIASGIVINGLAILIRPSSAVRALDDYYTDCVIGGPGSFVLPVHRPEDFAVAIRQKLVMEVSGIEPDNRPLPVETRPRSNCLAGESFRQFFLAP